MTICTAEPSNVTRKVPPQLAHNVRVALVEDGTVKDVRTRPPDSSRGANVLNFAPEAAMQNRQFKLKSRPQGMVKASDFDFVTAAAAEPGAGEALVRTLYLSLDPAMRGWMNEGKSYVPPVGIGEVMRALGVGRVVKSNDPELSVGDTVTGLLGVQDYALCKAKELTRINPKLAPLPRFLGALGMPGMTAYFGLLDVGQPKAGETVVVSAASGAVGAIVAQIAKIVGCRVIGIAGGKEKCDWLTRELGIDGVIDYKGDDVRARLKELAPKGVDVYFDNVGGEILDTVLAQLAKRARVVICGAISQYNNEQGAAGPKNYMMLLVARARMEGFVVFDYMPRYLEGAKQIATWMAEGKLKTKEDIVQGLERFPEALLKLYSGENFGKLVLEVAAE
jgi:NADPH-dependent curcumin reductase